MITRAHFSQRMGFQQDSNSPLLLAILAHQERGLALQRLLGLCGYQVLLAADANEALDLAARYTFELVLLDAQLPEAGPLVALMQLREQTDYQGPVVVLDTLPDEATRDEWQARNIAYVPTLPSCATLEVVLAAYITPSTASISRRAPSVANVARAALNNESAAPLSPAARKARPWASLLRAAS
jgi:CheY-like chemotaxis protein